MHTTTCSTAASATAAAGATAATTTSSLWRRLIALQPTLSLTSAAVHPPPPTKASPSAPTSMPPMSYSFVVVPPPVPAATASFESHIASLLTHVPVPVFITCTSYSPYFNTPDEEAQALQGTHSNEEVSATQQALSHLNAKLPPESGLVLTITGTRATTTTTVPEKNTAADSKKEGGAGAPTTLTGASKDGVRAVVFDFAHHTTTHPRNVQEGSEASTDTFSTAHRPGGLMVLRGDDGGYTRHVKNCVSAEKEEKDAALPNPYATFADGAALLRFVRDVTQNSPQQQQQEESSPSATSVRPAVADLCLLTGAYAQGHVLDRIWGTTASSLGTSEEGVLPFQHQQPASLSFLKDVEDVYTKTEAQLRQAHGTHNAPRQPSVETCSETVAALQRRLDTVRKLWETPSLYAGDARAACARWMVQEKVLKGGARVLVTQMLTSAQELVDFVADVQGALRDLQFATAGAPTDTTHHETSPTLRDPLLVVVPGLMAPLRGEQFVRATLQLKVIPSPPLRSALRAYEAALTAAHAQLLQGTTKSVGGEVDASSAGGDANAHGDAVANEEQRVKAFASAKEAAEMDFQRSMEHFTASLVQELHALGYGHVNFSAFQYGCGESVGRVVAQLPHKQCLL